MSFTNKKKARAGQFWTINNKSAKGHKGRISKINKDGTFKAVVITHAPKVKLQNGKKVKTIRLKRNPNKQDAQSAYAVPKPTTGKVNKHLGKQHPEMKVVNKKDKSLFRKIGKKK